MSIKLSELPEVLDSLISVGETPCLIGPSGIGKTQAVSQFAESHGYELVPIYLVTKDPVDLAGFPVVRDGRVDWVPPSIFMASEGRKLFFLDEITHASTSVQSIAYQLIQERRVGDHTLPPNSAIIAAHNRVSDRGVHNRVPVPLRRRWFELYVEPDIDSWTRWALAHSVEPIVIAFLRARPELLYQDATGESPAPDPRAWAKISCWLPHSAKLSREAQHAVLCGKVGEGAAIEFSAYLRLYHELPDLDAVLMHPERAEVPSNPAAQYAVAIGIARKMTAGNIGRAVKYLDRLGAEYSVLAMQDALRRDNTLSRTPEFTAWAVRYQHVVS